MSARVLFLVSDLTWTGRARAFMLAARGLRAKGYDTIVACEEGGQIEARAKQADVPVLPMDVDASAAGDAWRLRKDLQARDVDVVFVHTDEEMLVATSAVRLGRRAGAVIRRVPPFEVVTHGAGARFATRLASTGLLFTTESDRDAADLGRHRVPASVAPLGVDHSETEAAKALARTALGAKTDSRIIVCVHDDSEKRRVLTALRTVSLLAPRHPELHLVVMGATRQDELRMHGAALGINAYVTYVDTTDELGVIRAADVGWVAAEGDAAALAALDFMACGTAILAERNPLTEHYIADGIAGSLLTPADPTTTAAIVAAFLAKNDQRVAMGRSGRARLLREFSFEAMIRGFEEVITAASTHSPQVVG
jgi:glycosyltransferase involved in cell wall biosynthesis